MLCQFFADFIALGEVPPLPRRLPFRNHELDLGARYSAARAFVAQFPQLLRVVISNHREYFIELTKSYDTSTILVHRLLGLPDFPKVKVRAELRYPDGPPKEWGE